MNAKSMIGSRVFKTAVCAGVLGLLVSSTQASLLTLDVQAASGSNGATVVDAKDVTLAPGSTNATVNLNIYAVLHSTNATQTDDGLALAFLSLAGGSGNTGTFGGANVAPFNVSGSASPGTPLPNSLGPDHGTAVANTGQSFQAVGDSGGGAPIMGTAATPGDLTFLIGTATVVYSGAGSTTISIFPHIDTNNTSGGRKFNFNLDGHNYALNGNGAGSVDGGASTLSAGSGAIDTGSAINVAGSAVPEPTSLALVGLGGLGLLMRRRRN
jgi:hypothetical protein